MAELHLICGLPGSGKSTLARKLASAANTIWLSPDDWMNRIVGDGYDEPRREAVEAIQWEIATKLLELGINVILDNGFWTREERVSLRTQAALIGAKTHLHFLDVPLAELKRRLDQRNSSSPLWNIEVDDLDLWSKVFQPPEDDELSAPPS